MSEGIDNLPSTLLDQEVHTSLVDLLKSRGYTDEKLRICLQARCCCEYCDEYLLHSVHSWHSSQWDHIVPGGPFDHENIALSCQKCNSIKRDKIPPQYCGNRKEFSSLSRPDKIRLLKSWLTDARKEYHLEEEFNAFRTLNESANPGTDRKYRSAAQA
ncbi:MAG: hypothetical protein FLDDKLPJ_01542 [Phycisphaerae bacterium]|nr:hypothetical protein [Phycisphaerae bacterium]